MIYKDVNLRDFLGKYTYNVCGDIIKISHTYNRDPTPGNNKPLLEIRVIENNSKLFREYLTRLGTWDAGYNIFSDNSGSTEGKIQEYNGYMLLTDTPEELANFPQFLV